jgi:hypothetical protein
MEPAELKNIAAGFIPDEFSRLDWRDVWERPVRSGTGLEWTVFTAIVWALRRTGWKVEFPHLAGAGLKEFFPGHNQFPSHHAGKAGHSSLGPKAGLLIAAALTPKAIGCKNERWISIFREGCAYHRIYASASYGERPDILIALGRPAPGFPSYDERTNTVVYRYIVDGSQTIEGTLRAVNSVTPSIILRSPSGGYQFVPLAIIECSINKLEKRALEQIGSYQSRFFGRQSVNLVLISGQPLAIPWIQYVVDVSGDAALLQGNLAAAAVEIVKSLIPNS